MLSVKFVRLTNMFAIARFRYIDFPSLYVPRTSLYRGSYIQSDFNEIFLMDSDGMVVTSTIFKGLTKFKT